MSAEALASEGGHWYRADGSPCYKVPRKGKPGADGSLTRPTTLRDARELRLFPSVTTIGRIKAAHGLEKWKRDKCIMAALTLTRKPGEPDDEFVERVAEDAAREARDAADWGTAMHACVESAILGRPYDPAFKRHVEGALEELRRGILGAAEWETEKSFACAEHGFAGKVDLHSLPRPSVPVSGWIVDLKGKEFYSGTKRLAWAEQGTQLAGYRLGLGLKDAKCANLFVSRSVPGLARLHIWSAEESERHERLFLATLRLWEIENDYSARGIAA